MCSSLSLCICAPFVWHALPPGRPTACSLNFFRLSSRYLPWPPVSNSGPLSLQPTPVLLDSLSCFTFVHSTPSISCFACLFLICLSFLGCELHRAGLVFLITVVSSASRTKYLTHDRYSINIWWQELKLNRWNKQVHDFHTKVCGLEIADIEECRVFMKRINVQYLM